MHVAVDIVHVVVDIVHVAVDIVHIVVDVVRKNQNLRGSHTSLILGQFVQFLQGAFYAIPSNKNLQIFLWE